jgi:hypothetical protein
MKVTVPGACLLALLAGCRTAPTHDGRSADEWFAFLAEAHEAPTKERAAANERFAAAMDALGPAAVPAMARAVARHPSPHVREAVAYALGRQEAAALPAVPALLVALDTGEFMVWEAVDGTLGNVAQLRPGAVVPQLAAALGSRPDRVRLPVLEILTILGPRARPALPAIRPLLSDANIEIREAAQLAIEEIESD